jgi:hypothetical protein
MLQQLAGRWSVVASNPRLIVSPGGTSGATVTMEGNRFESTDRADFNWLTTETLVGSLTLSCNATSCGILGGFEEIRSEGGVLVFFEATGKRYGTGNGCSLPDLPGRGELTVVRRTTIGGVEVPAEMRMTGGDSTWTTDGQGGECADASAQAAWDLTWTRRP